MLDSAATVRVTILADNLVTGGKGCLGEHGLCLFVEADDECFLLDVGQSGIAVGNAARLGCDISRAETIVISHGHYDHMGALPMVLQAFGPRKVIAHPDLLTPKYVRHRGRRPREAGVPFSAADLGALGAQLSLSAEPQPICRGATTTGVVPQLNDFEAIPAHFAIQRGQRMRRDDFAHDQGVVVRTPRGLVVLVGCSHRGIVNVLHRAMDITGIDRIAAVVGGLHLGGASQDRVSATVDALRALAIEHVVACHCTGFAASAKLAAALGEAYDPGGVGFSLTL